MIDEQQSGCASHEPYALQVTDDSMEPEFVKGCVIVVEPAGHAENGNFIVVDYANDTWFRQYVYSDGRHWLRALNPEYDDMEVTGPFNIRGVVISQSFKRQRKRYI